LENVEAEEVKDLPLELIYWPDPTDITEDQIKNMALSLTVHGQIEPIVVCSRDEKGYRGVIGRLRYDGMKYRWRNQPEGKAIQARIRKFESEIEVKMWQLAENLHRREISAMQRARQLKNLHDILRKETGEDATIQTLAATIEDITGNKESVKTIQHYLSLTKLEPKTQEILTGEKMPLRYGLEILKIKTPEKQVEVAKEVSERSKPDYQGVWQIRNVEAVKEYVESVTVDERRERQDEKLRKKAEELRSEGKIVYVADELSWEDKQKKLRSFQFTLTPMPGECKDCPKLGIELERNFHQEPVCTSPGCYEKKYKEKVAREKREQEETTREWREEKAKVCETEPDIRHWRLALFGLIGNWDLKNLLHMSGKEWIPGRDSMEKAVLEKVQTLNEEECKKLLIHYAVDKVLTGPQRWTGENPVKIWAVKEFGLKQEVFTGEAEKDE